MTVLYWIFLGLNLTGAVLHFTMLIWRNHERRLAQEDRERTGTAAGAYLHTAQAPAVPHAGAYPGVIRGWRQYAVSKDGVLIGGYAHHWQAASFTASCAMWGHSAPRADCDCGIYVLPRREDVELPNRLLAEVVAWGEVVECCPHGAACADATCVTGWRAEHVRIERIHSWADDQYTAAMLRAHYGVEVVMDVEESPLTFQYVSNNTQFTFYSNCAYAHLPGQFCGACGRQ